MTGPKFERGGVRGRGWLPQLLPQPEAKSRKGRREPELSVTRPVAQLSDKSRVNSSSYRNEALASHGGSQVLNVAPQTERNPGHSGAMAGASKAAAAVDATGSLSVGARAVPDSERLEACSICEVLFFLPMFAGSCAPPNNVQEPFARLRFSPADLAGPALRASSTRRKETGGPVRKFRSLKQRGLHPYRGPL